MKVSQIAAARRVVEAALVEDEPMTKRARKG
jgi:hypothetical protein